MRIIPVELDLDFGSPIYISIFSDLHLDSELCDIKALKAIADERRELPNHRAIAIGDLCDLILPPDLRRFRPGLRPDAIAQRDDFLMASIERCIEILRGLGLKWDMIGSGNHEDEALKRHGVNATAIIADALGAAYGGYAGVVRYLCRQSTTKVPLTIAYHHGAWGGKFAKGYIGAREWFDHLDGWDIAAYGHCHASRVDPELRYAPKVDHMGRWTMERRTVYLVNCSSFVNADHYSGHHYAERRGHPPQPMVPPLIKVVFRRSRGPRGRAVIKQISVQV